MYVRPFPAPSYAIAGDDAAWSKALSTAGDTPFAVSVRTDIKKKKFRDTDADITGSGKKEKVHKHAGIDLSKKKSGKVQKVKQ